LVTVHRLPGVHSFTYSCTLFVRDSRIQEKYGSRVHVVRCLLWKMHSSGWGLLLFCCYKDLFSLEISVLNCYEVLMTKTLDINDFFMQTMLLDHGKQRGLIYGVDGIRFFYIKELLLNELFRPLGTKGTQTPRHRKS